ncbi:GNAT family N-acetyltransferase [Clostridium sp. B9]|uniref:GNAT family N-acetyltransferase n=1 Tax=Clostridium sp. B9 TaxID=3423224 RepID=UPI003D2F17B2
MIKVERLDFKDIPQLLELYKELVNCENNVEDVVVKENTRGLGVGRMLMDELDCFAKARKCAYAIVVSSDYRETAHKFYEKVGFVDGVLGFRKIYK